MVQIKNEKEVFIALHLQINKNIDDSEICNDIDSIFASFGIDDTYTTTNYQILGILSNIESFNYLNNSNELRKKKYKTFYKSIDNNLF